MIEGVRGNGFRGDIAIDDLQFHAGYCTTAPPNAHQSHTSTTGKPTSSSSTTASVRQSSPSSTSPVTATTSRRPTTLGRSIA